MRASPTRLSGFKLTLPAGWYTLPWYMPRREVRRLLELLQMGLDVDYAVELEWAGLDEVAGRANLDKCVVILRIPADVDPKLIPGAQTKLGGVRIGLVLHERAGDWAVVDWQQHYIKVPLLSALNRELHLEQHPFADLGIDVLPLEELAKLTAEPVELLELLDAVIDHRLQHAGQGLAREDWRRSIDLAVADRLAARLRKIPSDESRAAALDFALDAQNQSLWPAIERREASEALAHVGLAWREGGDVLIGALARQSSEPRVLRRFLTQLPGSTWSDRSRAALAEVMPKELPWPRAAEITPEPSYARLQVPSAFSVIQEIGERIEASLDAHEIDDFREFVEPLSVVDLFESSWHPWDESPWAVAANAIHAAFMELRDDALLEFDFERGRLHRFDAVDRVLTDFPGHIELRALVRWQGVTKLTRRTFDHRHLTILAREIECSAESLGNDDLLLASALRVTLGDLHALRQDYAKALDWWASAAHRLGDEIGLIVRRMLAILRIGRFDETWEQLRSLYADRRFKDWGEYRNVFRVVDLLMRQEPESGYSLSATYKICRAAIALEREDWPLAFNLLESLHDATPPEAARARVLWAWTRAALGDIDLAGATFEDLEQLATSWSDEQLASFAAQGRAWVASQGSNR